MARLISSLVLGRPIPLGRIVLGLYLAFDICDARLSIGLPSPHGLITPTCWLLALHFRDSRLLLDNVVARLDLGL